MFQYMLELNLARSKESASAKGVDLPAHTQEIVEDRNIAVEKLWKKMLNNLILFYGWDEFYAGGVAAVVR